MWWLYDDGGLTLLIPHLLTVPKSYLEVLSVQLLCESRTNADTPPLLGSETACVHDQHELSDHGTGAAKHGRASVKVPHQFQRRVGDFRHRKKAAA